MPRLFEEHMVDDEAKTKAELITELQVLRRQLVEHTIAQHADGGGPTARRW